MLTLLAQGGLPLNISGAVQALPDNPFKYTDLGVFISNVVGIAIIFSGIFALLYLLWGGFEWITSGGDKGAMENARNKIIAALVGLILVVATWAIFGLVQVFLGLDVAQISGGGGGGGGGGGAAEHGPRCPGPNCDRCPGGTRDPLSCSDPEWEKNIGCGQPGCNKG